MHRNPFSLRLWTLGPQPDGWCQYFVRSAAHVMVFVILPAICCPRGTIWPPSWSMTFTSHPFFSHSMTNARLCAIYVSVWPPRMCAVGIEIPIWEFSSLRGWRSFAENSSDIKPSQPRCASDFILFLLGSSSDSTNQGESMRNGKQAQMNTAHSTSCLPTVLCCIITLAARAAPCENPRRPSNGPSSSIMLMTSSWASAISAADGGKG